jgi:hypothetical protein
MNNWQQRQTDGIPNGFVYITSDDGQHYLVPPFMILATHQAMEAYHQKLEFNVHNADQGVSFHFKVLAAELYGCCRCIWPLPMCMATAEVYDRCRVLRPLLFLLFLPCLMADSLYTPCSSSIFSPET